MPNTHFPALLRGNIPAEVFFKQPVPAPDLMTISTFSLDFEGHRIHGDQWLASDARRHAVLLHGGGSSTLEAFTPLREHLLGENISSTSFDFIGHGRTGGKLLGSSLHARVKQTLIVMKAMQIESSEAALVGYSMGAYVALHVAKQRQIGRLALGVPAAYAPEAFDVPFGPGFSAILRRENSWQESDAFTLIRKFCGHLFVFYGSEDQVVPDAIPLTFVASAQQAASVDSYALVGGGHKLSAHYEKHPEDRETVHQRITNLIRR